MPTIIRHRVRGLKLGRPAGSGPFKLTIQVTGRPDYRADAESIFSFLFAHVPDGTMQELVRLLADRLTWAADLLTELPAVAPAPLTWQQLLELKDLLEADRDATVDAVRRVSGPSRPVDAAQIPLF
jgi:hypothetical protein